VRDDEKLDDAIRRLEDMSWEDDERSSVTVVVQPTAPPVAPPRSLPAPAKGALAVLHAVPERQRIVVVLLLLVLALGAGARRLGWW
jgi:hypothetical protein